MHEPQGEIISGMYFADNTAGIIESVHYYHLKQSPTFTKYYLELLGMLNKRYGRTGSDDSRVTKAELDGTYVLPPSPKPKQEKKQEEPIAQQVESISFD